MRVTHVIPSTALQWGGPVAVVRNIARAVADFGVSTNVITTSGRRVGVAAPIEDLPILAGSTSFLASIWTGHSRELGPIFDHILRETDILHIHELWHFPHWSGARAARKHGVPYIVTPHGELDPWRLRYRGWKKRPYLALVQRRILARAAVVHATTSAEVSEIRAHAPRTQVRVIPNGVDIDELSDRSGRYALENSYPRLRGKRVVLFLGRLQKAKGLDVLVEGFSYLAKTFEDLALLVAGPDEGYKATMCKALSEAGLLDRSTFTGFVTGEDKRQVLAGADIFVLPSYGEGFSTAVLEAMASGLPVVITEQCKFPQVKSSQAGLIIEPDPAQLADAMRQLIEHPERARAMGQHGRSLVRKRYSWTVAASEMHALYRTVLADRVARQLKAS
ncbi:MAG TPA: glycosyltransferase [Gammaproteobacteria bacterium]|nr:glycosyltransferase [Gammaproteobacteria bacterium]